jgi:hypothetical protein
MISYRGISVITPFLLGEEMGEGAAFLYVLKTLGED